VFLPTLRRSCHQNGPPRPRDRRQQVPVCIQRIDFEVFWSTDYASLSQAVDHLRIPVAADVGVAGGAANRLLPLVLVAAEQEIGDSFFGDNATRTDFRRRGVMLGTSSVRSSQFLISLILVASPDEVA